jgi:hypothetical protein
MFGLEQVGEIVWNQSGQSLDAHCSLHSDCHINRTIHGSKHKKQNGRPVGMLVAWLLSGISTDPDLPVYGTRDEHFGARLGKGRDQQHLTLEKRREARQLVEDDLAWHAWLASIDGRERPPRDSEGAEPERLC